jgi:Tfp pilus assembly protein PilX
MYSAKSLAASGLALMLTLGAPLAWAQTAPGNGRTPDSAYQSVSLTNENVTTMDQQVSRQIRQAWSEGKDATAAMAFQENAEIAMSDGKEKEAMQYLQAAERELQTLQPVRNKY